MFAYVKIVEGSYSGTKAKVNVQNIRYNFQSCDDFDKKKKYYVKYGEQEKYYKAQIIFLKESYQDLLDAISMEKQRLAPTRSCLTTDGESVQDELQPVTKSKTVLVTQRELKSNCANSKILTAFK